jgi:ADP-ribosylglycohydrolase
LDTFFERCLYETNMLGGDTDTNGAIVGGMIGALVGFSRIPEYM